VSEDECGAEFAFADGSTEKASLLIGADGIYSKVCSYVAPSVTPQSSGFLAITYAVKRSSLRIPTGEDLASPMTWTGRHRAFVLAPQDVDGSEFLAGKQVAFQEQNMAGWDSLFNDKEKLVGLIRKGQDDEPDLVQSALENVNPSIFTIWPFCIVPRLEK
jgi:2-polyprenyl-6-methoxyphenol hydroxylase-like FAD-dependent oxidoreductase